MKHILFVDDERKVLEGIRRTLRIMRHEWTMTFIDSGQGALEALETRPCDVIVSDIRMPNMNGVQLLSKVKSRYPHIVRIALSGYADSELMAECTKAAHQFLSKPCNIEKIKATIERACVSKEALTDSNLVSLISKLDSLPSLPSLYSEIMDEITSPAGSIQKIGAIIGKDVSMTAKILQLVNSSFYGLSENISTVKQAVTMLGFDVIRSLVLSSKIFDHFDNQTQNGMDLDSLWLHSGQTGAAAFKVAMLAGTDRKIREAAQMAGVLHDIGILILQKNMPLEYGKVKAMCRQESIELWCAEKKIIGHTHMDVGAYLLALWGIQSTIVEAVAYHHCPSAAPARPEFSPLAAVHIANSFIHTKLFDDHPAAPLDTDFLSNIGVIEQLPQWRERCMVADEHVAIQNTG